MGNVFGRKSRPSRVTEQDRAILQLKQQRDKLKHYQKRVTLQLEKERSLAKQLLKDGKKEKALVLLKKKRYQDQLLDKTENQISNLERMVRLRLLLGPMVSLAFIECNYIDVIFCTANLSSKRYPGWVYLDVLYSECYLNVLMCFYWFSAGSSYLNVLMCFYRFSAGSSYLNVLMCFYRFSAGSSYLNLLGSSA
uniref:Charged multivesicular body protein 6a n=1 Tax=Hucho hucho TaxID=62062 RepID=A0A4W5P6X1_9TELE